MSKDAFVVVDIEDFTGGGEEGRARQVATVREALARRCFIRVKSNLGADVIEQAYAIARRVLALGPDVLAKYIVPGNQVGFIPFGSEKAAGAIYPDLKEFWQVYQPRLADTQEKQFINVWPDEEEPAFQGIALMLFAELQRVSQGLLGLTALALGLSAEHFAAMTVRGPSILRIIHYPPIPPDARGVRSAEHTDINLGTSLLTSQGGGLQLLDHNTGEWLAVEHHPEYIVFNWADMIWKATGGQVPSVVHQVVNPADPELRAQSRYSMVFFCHPRDEIVLEEASDLVDGKGPLTAHMYLWLRLWEIYLSDERPAWYVGPDRAPRL